MINKIESVWSKIPMFIYIAWGFWYVFFNASIELRPYYNILWPCLCIVGLIWKFKSITRNSKLFKQQIAWYLLFFAICMFTLMYSLAFSTSLLYVQRLVLAFMFSIVITSENNDKIIISVIGFYTLILLLISIIQYVYPPIYMGVFYPLLSGKDSELALSALRSGEILGFTNGTSQNGLMMCTGFLIFITKAFFANKNKWLYIFVAFVFWAMIFATGKRSYSGISIIVFLMELWFSNKSSLSIKHIFRICLMIALAYLAYMVALEYFPEISHAFDKFESKAEEGDVLNNRGEIYSSVFKVFKENPLGVGVGAIDYITGSAHNSYLQWLTEFGLLFFPFVLYSILRTPLLYFKIFKAHLNKSVNTEKCMFAMCAFVYMFMVFTSAFVALPLQWTNVMIVFFTFQFIFLRNIQYR